MKTSNVPANRTDNWAINAFNFENRTRITLWLSRVVLNESNKIIFNL